MPARAARTPCARTPVKTRSAKPKWPKDPATAYALAVVARKRVAGRLVRLACERHLRDLQNGHERGLHWDVAEVEYVLWFFGHLRHSKGEWAKQGFALSDWQIFILGSLFAWKKADGTRRFATAYDEIPRKNGKSTLASGIALLLLCADAEPGADIYAAATTRDQARLVFNEAKRMATSSPHLALLLQVYRSEIRAPEESSFVPLGADGDKLDGLNPHGVIIDELHAHKTRAIVDVMSTADGARRQPLQFEITTAGYDRRSVCYEHHDYSVQVLEGRVQDDSWFAFIASIDKGDKWYDPKVWAKANPNLGISVKLATLEKAAKQAQRMPGAQNAFRRLRLNEWTEQSSRAIDLDVWDENGRCIPAELLTGRDCFGGLDLASVSDIAAFVLLFPPLVEADPKTPAADLQPDNLWAMACRFYIPRAGLEARIKKGEQPWQVWIEGGHLTVHDGNVIDFTGIQNDILADRGRYRIREIAFDRWNATQLSTNLIGEGLEMVGVGQGFASMAGPMREFERLLLGARLAHGGHPVLRWMAGNLAVKQDPAGNRKPDKSRSGDKIDGIAAALMALNRATVFTTDQDTVDYAPGEMFG